MPIPSPAAARFALRRTLLGDTVVLPRGSVTTVCALAYTSGGEEQPNAIQQSRGSARIKLPLVDAAGQALTFDVREGDILTVNGARRMRVVWTPAVATLDLTRVLGVEEIR